MKHKPYHDVPDSDESETEEFNINISLNGSKAYRTEQPDNRKWLVLYILYVVFFLCIYIFATLSLFMAYSSWA